MSTADTFHILVVLLAVLTVGRGASVWWILKHTSESLERLSKEIKK